MKSERMRVRVRVRVRESREGSNSGYSLSRLVCMLRVFPAAYCT